MVHIPGVLSRVLLSAIFADPTLKAVAHASVSSFTASARRLPAQVSRSDRLREIDLTKMQSRAVP